MAITLPVPGSVGLRYGSADVFASADTRAKRVAWLAPGDAFTVLGAEGEFYRVELPGAVTGFVYAHNVTGTNLPLTAAEQRQADEHAALAAQPKGGWLGWVRRHLP